MKKNRQNIKMNSAGYIFLLLLAVISFYLELFVISTYFIVSIIYLKYFSDIFPCPQLVALKLQEEVEETDYNAISTSYPFILGFSLFCAIGIFFDFLIAKLYFLVFILITSLRILGFKIAAISTPLLRLLKNVKKDFIIIKYNWYAHLKELRCIKHINTITLISSSILGPMLAHLFSEWALDFNYLLWHLLLMIQICFVTGTNIYIIWKP